MTRATDEGHPGHPGDPGDRGHRGGAPDATGATGPTTGATGPTVGDVTRTAPGEWRGVSPRYVGVELVGWAVTGLVVTAPTAFLWLIDGWWPKAVTAAVAVVFVVVCSLTPRRVRAIGYQLREDDLLLRRGILFSRIVAVPYGRMQLVDMERGPVVRALGLSDLKLVTAAAASAVSVPGLPLAEAEGLRDHLVELAESRRAGL